TEVQTCALPISSARGDRNIAACADMAGGAAGVIVVLNEQTKLSPSRDAPGRHNRYVAAVVDLPVCILNNQIEIAHGGQITADIHTNISARSDMRALVRDAQARKVGD